MSTCVDRTCGRQQLHDTRVTHDQIA